MPSNIASPSVASPADRLSLTASAVRAADGTPSAYGLCANPYCFADDAASPSSFGMCVMPYCFAEDE